MTLQEMKQRADLNARQFLEELRFLPLHPQGDDLYLRYRNLCPKVQSDVECVSVTDGSLALFLEIINEAYNITEPVEITIISPTVQFNSVSSYYWELALQSSWKIEVDRRKYTAKFCLAYIFKEVGSRIYEYI